MPPHSLDDPAPDVGRPGDVVAARPLVVAEDHRAVLDGDLHAVVAARGSTMSGQTLERRLPVLVEVLRCIAAHERVDEGHAHLLAAASITSFRCAIAAPLTFRIGMQRVRIVAQPRDRQALRVDLVDDLLRPTLREVGDIDVGGAGVATGRPAGRRPAGDLQAFEPARAAQPATSHERCVGEGSRQEAEPHAGTSARRDGAVRSTSTQRPSRALAAIGIADEHLVVAVGEGRVRRDARAGRPPRHRHRSRGTANETCPRSPRRGQPGSAAAACAAGYISAGSRMRISFGRSRCPIQSWSGCSESHAAAAAEPSISYWSEFLRPGLSWLMATAPRAPFSKRRRMVAVSSV